MAILPIHLLGSPVLREHATDVTDFDDALRAFVADMFETMDLAMGVGLAANQVGRATRVAVIDADDHRFVMINPTVTNATGSASADEGCLSIPEAFAEVTRPERIALSAFDEHGAPFSLELDGLAKATAPPHPRKRSSSVPTWTAKSPTCEFPERADIPVISPRPIRPKSSGIATRCTSTRSRRMAAWTPSTCLDHARCRGVGAGRHLAIPGWS